MIARARAFLEAHWAGSSHAAPDTCPTGSSIWAVRQNRNAIPHLLRETLWPHRHASCIGRRELLADHSDESVMDHGEE